jgi:hypothetical protein
MMDDENEEAVGKAAAEKETATGPEAKAGAGDAQKHHTGWGSPEKGGGQHGDKPGAARGEEDDEEDEVPKGRRRNLRDQGSDEETEMVRTWGLPSRLRGGALILGRWIWSSLPFYYFEPCAGLWAYIRGR